MTTKGTHLVCELSGCAPELLANRIFVEDSLLDAARVSKATIIDSFFHEFSPQGVTGFVCLAESHISIHTWPERGYAAVDIYTCGTHTSPELAINHLKKQFGAGTAISRTLHRGIELSDDVFGNIMDEQQVESEGEVTTLADDTSEWIPEGEDDGERHALRVEKILVDIESEFQDITILENRNYGKILLLDGASQSAAKDEHIYHEALIQPAMLLHQAPRSVLILGGGEGASLREVLRHTSVTEAVMVDIDGELVDACKEHLPEWSAGAFEDPRAELVIDDGYAWVQRTTRTFDIIVMDLTDQIDFGPSFPLYTTAFFERLKACLNPGGIVVIQAGALSTLDYLSHCSVRKTLCTSFEYTQTYLQFVPSFFSEWSFILASDTPLDVAGLEAQLIAGTHQARLNTPLRSYEVATHRRMFSVPSDVQALLDTQGFIVSSLEEFQELWTKANATTTPEYGLM